MKEKGDLQLANGGSAEAEKDTSLGLGLDLCQDGGKAHSMIEGRVGATCLISSKEGRV